MARQYFNESPTRQHVREWTADRTEEEARAWVQVTIEGGSFGMSAREMSRLATDLLVAELNRREQEAEEEMAGFDPNAIG
jgi:hypothetical protein